MTDLPEGFENAMEAIGMSGLISFLMSQELAVSLYLSGIAQGRQENKIAESLADRMQLCKDRYNDIPQCLIDEARALEAQFAKYQYTPQAYDEMWARVKEAVNENDKLKAQLEDCTAVNAEVMKKVARLEKSINNQEIDSN